MDIPPYPPSFDSIGQVCKIQITEILKIHVWWPWLAYVGKLIIQTTKLLIYFFSKEYNKDC